VTASTIAAWLVAFGCASATAQPAPGEAPAFLQVVTPREESYVQQPIRVRLRFGFERAFLEENLLQPFRATLDVPARVEAGWLDELPGTVLLEPAPGEEPRASFVLDGERTLAGRSEAMVEGRRFTVLEIERVYLPVGAGELEIPGATLRYAYATRFTEDFLNGRVPEDRSEAQVRAPGRTIRIRPLPEDGRPPAFTGAVGRFTVHAGAEPRELRAGDSLKLVLRIEGEGNLAFFDPPSLEDLAGFHVYGKLDETTNGRRTVTYDVAPLGEHVRAIPSIALAYFDPGPPAAYRTALTEPIPLDVRPLPEGARLEPLPGAPGEEAGAGRTDIHDVKPVGPSDGAGRALAPALAAAVLVLPWALALGLAVWLRRRDRDRRDPAAVRARTAAREFRSRTERAGTDVGEAFAAYLAARMRCTPAAVITPDLGTRLVGHGLPGPLAARAAAELEGLVASRFGGRAADRSEEVRSLVDELESAFRSRQER